MRVNFTRLLCNYCSESPCPPLPVPNVWIDTCIVHITLTVVHLIVTTTLAYLVGVLPALDDLDRRIRATRRPLESRLVTAQFVAIVVSVIGASLDFQTNYVSLIGADAAGLVFVVFRIASYVCLFAYTARSFAHFDSSLCRAVTVQVLHLFLLSGLAWQIVWFQRHVEPNPVEPIDLLYFLIQFAALFIHSLVGLYLYSYQRRHSLYYESFADNQSSTEIADSQPFHLPAQIPLWSRLMFSWIRPLLKKALENRLKNVSDIFALPRSMTCSNVTERLQRTCIERQYRPESVHLLPLLWFTFRRHFLFLGILRVSADMLAFSAPLLLSRLLQYVDAGQATNDGFMFAVAILVSQTLSALAITHFDLQAFRVGLQLRAGTLSLLQQKLLRTGYDRLQNSVGTGKIMTLAGVDTDRLINVCSVLLQCISQPAQVLIALYLLYGELGLGAMAGVLFAVLILPVNKFVCDLIGKLTRQQLQHKDVRVRATSQLLTHTRVVRANHIQQVLRKQIEKERTLEMALLKKRKYLDAVCVYFWATTPLLVSLGTFGTCTLLGQKLDAARVFTSLTLLNMLVVPLNALPWILQGLVECYVSLQRLQTVFDLKSNHHAPQPMQDMPTEISLSAVDLDASSEKNHNLSVQTKKGDAIDWNLTSDDPSIDVFMRNLRLRRDLDDLDSDHFVIGPLNLKIPQGSFVGVIGPIGCGKSSLLQALGGEFTAIDSNSSFGVHKKILENGIGYVSQQPWIQNASVRNNILFGKNFEYRFYNDVLDACALRPDLTVNNYEILHLNMK
jgi:ABC-type multidrug transport system fused ATPase/permease subunit